jgi:hypothetical protein
MRERRRRRSTFGETRKAMVACVLWDSGRVGNGMRRRTGSEEAKRTELASWVVVICIAGAVGPT